MIVRIMGEGQFDVDDSTVGELNKLDEALESACQGDDEQAFQTALTTLLDRVRAVGRPVPEDVLEPSDLILPPADASAEDVREMLGEGGLIPG